MPAQKPDNKHDWILNTSGNERNGQWYYLEDHTSSAGVSGKFHVYYDGTKEWLANTPTPLATAGPSPAMTVPPAGLPAWDPAPPAPAAPAPAAPPVQPNGGVQAPDNPQPAAPAPGAITLVPVSVGTATLDPPSPAPASATPSADPSSDGAQTPVVITPGPASNTGGLSDSNSADDGNTIIGIPTGENLPQQSSDDGNTIISIPAGETLPTANSEESSRLDASSAAIQDNLQAASSQAAGGTSYTVVAGDTMWDIAQANNMSLEQLVALNRNIDNPDLILPGQQINIGGDTPSAPTETAEAFPAASSYATSNTAAQQDTEDSGVGGWADGTGGSVPKDPINGIADSDAAQVQTDPLKINDDKPHED